MHKQWSACQAAEAALATAASDRARSLLAGRAGALVRRCHGVGTGFMPHLHTRPARRVTSLLPSAARRGATKRRGGQSVGRGGGGKVLCVRVCARVAACARARAGGVVFCFARGWRALAPPLPRARRLPRVPPPPPPAPPPPPRVSRACLPPPSPPSLPPLPSPPPLPPTRTNHRAAAVVLRDALCLRGCGS